MKKYYFLLLLLGITAVNCGGADVGTQLIETHDPDTGSLIVPEVRDVAIAVTSGTPQVAVDAGFASNGSTVSRPSGFTAEQCRYTAAVANVDSSALSIRVAISSSGAVTCLKTIQAREEVPASTEGCVASYTMLCVK